MCFQLFGIDAILIQIYYAQSLSYLCNVSRLAMVTLFCDQLRLFLTNPLKQQNENQTFLHHQFYSFSFATFQFKKYQIST